MLSLIARLVCIYLVAIYGENGMFGLDFILSYAHIMKRFFAQGSFMRKFLYWEMIFAFIVIVWWATVFHFVEGWSYFDSLYYVVITMATIGYGDFVPVTVAGKTFAMVFAFLGVPLFIALTGLILEASINQRIKSYIYRLHKDIAEAQKKMEDTEHKIAEDISQTLENPRKRLWWPF